MSQTPIPPTDRTGDTTINNVPLLDLKRGNNPLREEILAAITRVCDTGHFLHGPDVKQLEQTFTEVCQSEHAVGCASGSDALLLALMAVGIESGDEVIVPSFTFFATASAVSRLGATPVFVDIESTTFNIDANLIEEAITPNTKAIIPVHLFGQCAEMDAICDIAGRHNLFVIEDAAQSIGAKYQGKPAGSWGDIGCFSFYPTKNLGGYGDGGMLTAQDADVADRLQLLAGHGMRPRYYHSEIGINSRLDSMQAAVLNVKIQHLNEYSSGRQQNAARYHELFTRSGIDSSLTLPTTASDHEHVWNQYTIRVDQGRRDTLRGYLAEANIGSEIYYPVPLHQQKCFAALGYADGSLPETERAAAEVLCLPIFPELTAAEQQHVVRCIDAFFAAEQMQSVDAA